MNAEERAAIKARAEAATYVGGDVQELADDVLALLDALEAAEVESKSLWDNLYERENELSHMMTHAANAEAEIAAVEALEPTWYQGVYGCREDMFSRSAIRRALATTTPMGARRG